METLFVLNVKCPHCLKSLMDNAVTIDNEPSIKMDIKLKGETSWVRLSAVWGSYNIQSERKLNSGDIAEFLCPHCHKLLNIQQKCESCGAPKVEMNLNSGGSITVCSKRGCKKHAIEIDNVKDFLRIAEEQYNLTG
ncbi:MAG: hypothetical protein V1647_05245, partial [Pseudomonadota bacterium]